MSIRLTCLIFVPLILSGCPSPDQGSAGAQMPAAPITTVTPAPSGNSDRTPDLDPDTINGGRQPIVSARTQHGSTIEELTYHIRSSSAELTENGPRFLFDTRQAVTLVLSSSQTAAISSSVPFLQSAFMQNRGIFFPARTGMVILIRSEYQNGTLDTRAWPICTVDQDGSSGLTPPTEVRYIHCYYFDEQVLLRGAGPHLPTYIQKLDVGQDRLRPLPSRDGVARIALRADAGRSSAGSINMSMSITSYFQANVNPDTSRITTEEVVRLNFGRLHFSTITNYVGVMQWQSADGTWQGNGLWEGYQNRTPTVQDVSPSWRAVRFFFYTPESLRAHRETPCMPTAMQTIRLDQQK